MIDTLLNLHWIVVVLMMSVFLTGLSVITRQLVRRFVRKEHLRAAHDVAAVVYTNLGLVYGLVLGLMAVHGQERWVDLRKTAEIESGLIMGVGNAAMALGDSTGLPIARAAAQYAEAVAATEWEDELDGPSRQAQKSIRDLWNSVLAMQKSSARDLLASQSVLDITNQLVQVRMERVGLMREHVGSLLWVILLGGGVAMTVFLVLFAPERDVLHTVMMFITTLVVSSVLMLIFSYEHPTDGTLSLSPESYVHAAQEIKTMINVPR